MRSAPSSRSYRTLRTDKILSTIEALQRRIAERFPTSGLSAVCTELAQVAEEAQQRAESMARPMIWFRVVVVCASLALIGMTAWGLSRVEMPEEGVDVIDVVQFSDAAGNDLLLIGAAILSLITIESRVKRGRALAAIHELRSISHIIDMHQLTKDPEHALGWVQATASSPQRILDPFLLGRYLDYCTELLSLTSKIGAVYAEKINDSVAISAVNELEDLTTGLSQKIWQKIMLLHTVPGDAPPLSPPILPPTDTHAISSPVATAAPTSDSSSSTGSPLGSAIDSAH